MGGRVKAIALSATQKSKPFSNFLKSQQSWLLVCILISFILNNKNSLSAHTLVS